MPRVDQVVDLRHVAAYCQDQEGYGDRLVVLAMRCVGLVLRHLYRRIAVLPACSGKLGHFVGVGRQGDLCHDERYDRPQSHGDCFNTRYRHRLHRAAGRSTMEHADEK